MVGSAVQPYDVLRQNKRSRQAHQRERGGNKVFNQHGLPITSATRHCIRATAAARVVKTQRGQRRRIEG